MKDNEVEDTEREQQEQYEEEEENLSGEEAELVFDPNDLESVDEEDDEEDDAAVEDIEEGNFAQIRRKFMNEDDDGKSH